MWRLAAKHEVKVGFGTDLFGPEPTFQQQNLEFTARLAYFSSLDILKQATSVNAELLSMSGPRNPYQDGPLGVIKSGAYADLVLVDGNPVKDISVLADPEKNLMLIMKDGVIYKNTL
jgi:imidazolonepropionase-like amidohydrolase